MFLVPDLPPFSSRCKLISPLFRANQLAHHPQRFRGEEMLWSSIWANSFHGRNCELLASTEVSSGTSSNNNWQLCISEGGETVWASTMQSRWRIHLFNALHWCRDGLAVNFNLPVSTIPTALFTKLRLNPFTVFKQEFAGLVEMSSSP